MTGAFAEKDGLHLGHPIGAHGTRLAFTAILELNRRGSGPTAVALGSGGGQGARGLVRTAGFSRIANMPTFT